MSAGASVSAASVEAMRPKSRRKFMGQWLALL